MAFSSHNPKKLKFSELNARLHHVDLAFSAKSVAVLTSVVDAIFPQFQAMPTVLLLGFVCRPTV